MNHVRWVVDKADLKIQDNDGTVVIPDALEVFRLVFGKISGIDGTQVIDESPGTPDELNFSRYPLELKIKLESSNDKDKPAIKCSVIGILENGEHAVPNPMKRLADHMIVNNTWYPFVQGSLQEIRDILESVNIKSAGFISLKQYFLLNQISEKKYYIIDLTGGNTEILVKSDMHLLHDRSIQNFEGNLYSYQHEGFNWLSFLSKEDLGGIIADEMGLGKTVQVIALLASEVPGSGSPSLIVVPSTLIRNWYREFSKFAPSVEIDIHHGPRRTGFPLELKKATHILTTYETVVRDLSLFKMINWNIVVLDEAQAIKNPSAKRTKAVKKLVRRVSIAMTGTPVENKLTDLWSLTDFILPGFLGSLRDFENKYGNNSYGAAYIEPLVSPVLLRREVREVAKDLPDRIDVPQELELGHDLAEQYDEIRKEIIDEYGQLAPLVAITRLRMYCTHPILVNWSNGDPTWNFPKYIRLVQILEEIFDNGEKAIIFTSYTGMIDILMKDLPIRFGIYCDRIDGTVPQADRQARVDRFSNFKKPGVLILNPKVGGTGLNITAANHVIHYNLEWNPAVEDQASARAHRLGQERSVIVHRLFYADTVEEIIDRRLIRKRELAETAVVGTDGKFDNRQDLLDVLSKSPVRKNVLI